MMGDLRRARASSEVARLNSVGVYVIGSFESITDFLAAGTMQWQDGPALPDDMRSVDPCAVTISDTSFLAICGNDIREFDASISGPTSNEGWREAQRWPSLKTWRGSSPGCSKLGQKVIIAGGWLSDGNNILRSTEVLDLQTREITSGGDMAQRRMWFRSGAIIGSGGVEVLFVFGGQKDNRNQNIETYLNGVEEWVEESSTWKATNSLAEPRGYYGSTVAPKELVCPV